MLGLKQAIDEKLRDALCDLCWSACVDKSAPPKMNASETKDFISIVDRNLYN